MTTNESKETDSQTDKDWSKRRSKDIALPGIKRNAKGQEEL
jgi:hypothetical protein